MTKHIILHAFKKNTDMLRSTLLVLVYSGFVFAVSGYLDRKNLYRDLTY